jgi:predicted Zn-dependent protease
VFVLEGFFRELEPNDDELAMVIAHELSHIVHAHGEKKNDLGAGMAMLQLLVLSCVDPTGLVELALLATLQGLSFAWGRSYSRLHEAEADETGMHIVTRACFDPRRAAAMMAKFEEMDPGQVDSWTRSHPAPSTRHAALLAEGARLESDAEAQEHCQREQSDLRRALAALYWPQKKAPPTVASPPELSDEEFRAAAADGATEAEAAAPRTSAAPDAR